eukprot:g16440.t1
MNWRDVHYLRREVLPAVEVSCRKYDKETAWAPVSGEETVWEPVPDEMAGGFLQLPAGSEAAAHAWANVMVDKDGTNEAKWTFMGGANEPDVEKQMLGPASVSGGEELGATWAEMLGGGSGTGAAQLSSSTVDNIEEAVWED